MTALLRRLGLVAAVGYIFMFYSERMFWSQWRAEDGAAGSLMSWIVYSFAAAAALIAIRDYRVREVWALFLVGALVGWLVEGVFAMTLFGADGVPFPITVSWTGLAWHALITVTIGWYAMQWALLRSLRQTVLLSAALGLFWGIWSIFWDRQSPPVSGLAFLLHGLAATFGLVVAQCACRVLGASDFRPSRIEKIGLAAVILLWFGGVTVTQSGLLALAVLPPLFGLIYLALRANAAVETRPDFLAEIDRRFPWPRALALFLMPLLATLVHELSRATGMSVPTNLVVLAVTTPVGAVGFVLSLWRLLRRRPGATASVAPAR